MTQRNIVTLGESEFRGKKSFDKFIENHLPPAHLREEPDMAYRIKGPIVELFEIRPVGEDKAARFEEPGAIYVKNNLIWKVYRQIVDLEWRRFDPDSKEPG